MKINIKNIRVKSICATLFISLFLSCNSGVIEELEKKNTFFDSLIKIGHGFQEIFGSFGDAFGFSAFKSGDKRSAVGAHFEKIKIGLKGTKDKLDEFATKISSIPYADTTIVKGEIKGANDVFDKLIAALTKLAGATNDSTNDIGNTASGAKAGVADKPEVEVVIAGVKEIIDAAVKSGVQIEQGKEGSPVGSASGDGATGVLVGKNNSSAPAANAGFKLADEVAKADPWAMIDKIKDANAGAELSATSEAGALATKIDTSNTAGAKTNADLAAATALKAMTKGSGKLTANGANNEPDAVKAAGVSAVNKVLGILDLIIRKTVANNLEKIKEAVKKITYSETEGTNATEAGTVTK
ncbi:variable large family protein (plasmid) [Borrelia coriaceae]|uniref:Variable large protein n=1 Tax=Borrelia coriaceae ATCC 43381 TaxID=1408429 RepID=W5SWD9_9SPIR|nr:variable large family protein [Borrelia coriaceae]AHH11245.1 Variable major protein [Borrelia coriaceae ATCC 43381]UPA17443.1 variable large family protein [Borrelia coriaceae]